jgi:asparagine synthase (glutamine-hydrolysing)
MCGIAGVIGSKDRAHAKSTVQKMIATLARRGPDSEGIESWDRAVLGHRRLAIFDLSDAGRQPMLSADRSIGIVFNGSIYNYLELRRELSERGYRFFSHTDTEVLIHGYQEWGLSSLVCRLRGMFAFAVWDDRDRRLYLVRDRLGVKPLVFTIKGGILAFASTVRALRVAGYVGDLDESAVMDFLDLGFIPDDKSIYRGVLKVPAASIIEWSNGFCRTSQYWEPPTAARSSHVTFDDAVMETERLFLRSVDIRLRADVPVGTLLSGGIDSSLVCWAVTTLGGDVTAYTIGTPGDPWDETKAACETARMLGIRHQVLEMSDTEDCQQIVGELVSAYAEPFACASALGMLKISRAVASSAKVLLTGDGGDDVFLGYPRHRHLWLAEKLAGALPAVVKNGWRTYHSIVPRVGPLRRAAALCDYATGGLEAFVSYGNRLLTDQVNGLLGDRLLHFRSGDSDRPPLPNSGCSVLADLLAYERRTSFVGEYMTKVDGATMYYGLEARSPFLDHCLWEFASSLPFDLRLYRGRLKAILRELVRRRIHERVARRTKRGFGVPVQRWIVGRWRPLVEAVFRESVLDKEGWVRASSVLAHLESASRRGWAPHRLWYMFVLESWARHEQAII